MNYWESGERSRLNSSPETKGNVIGGYFRRNEEINKIGHAKNETTTTIKNIQTSKPLILLPPSLPLSSFTSL